MKERYLVESIRHLALENDKMAFISGPRQSGKTTAARSFMASREDVSRYGNWDDLRFRREWTKSPSSLLEFGESRRGSPKPLVVLDEIHKARAWKRTLKGLYDTRRVPCDIVVTGSARLDVYKKGGESLLGRYFGFRLHPFSLGELTRRSGEHVPRPASALAHVFTRGSSPAAKAHEAVLSRLLIHSGFPEPYTRHSAPFTRVWRRGRVEKLIREDLRDLSRIPELSRIEMLTSLLPERAANPLSLQSLREDLEVSYDTVKRWISYLKELFYLIELKPFATSIPRSLKKEGKLYLWDWAEVDDPGRRFENLVALHLMKAVHFWTDIGEGTFELFYVRDKEKREIDFLITRDRKPWFAIEAKMSDRNLSSSFPAFLTNLGHPRFAQVVRMPGETRQVTVGSARGVVIDASTFLAGLP